MAANAVEWRIDSYARWSVAVRLCAVRETLSTFGALSGPTSTFAGCHLRYLPVSRARYPVLVAIVRAPSSMIARTQVAGLMSCGAFACLLDLIGTSCARISILRDVYRCAEVFSRFVSVSGRHDLNRRFAGYRSQIVRFDYDYVVLFVACHCGPSPILCRG